MHFLHPQTSFKSKWHSIKSWFTPNDKQRKLSESSDTRCSCQQGLVQYKRPSLSGSESLHVVMDKCMSPFRRRPSTASSTVTFNYLSESRKAVEAYRFAQDEYNYAQDSRGSLYYNGDLIAAKEAMDHCEEIYRSLMEQCTAHQQNELNYTLGSNVRRLKTKLNNLPTQDDTCSL
ncbi:hypothetical protein G6F56_001411 [Rhizopus delemar]|nr:hypothetical protein G6F56_001411 [Rhizopus delemar]